MGALRILRRVIGMNQEIVIRLGYPAASKLLVIHADDFGMCNSVNLAIVELLDEERVTSASVMVPCPGFNDAAKYISSHRTADIGVHLTITSEWAPLRWHPVSGNAVKEGFTTPAGSFWTTVKDVMLYSRGRVLNELTAQVETAIRCGIKPTHLDTHMFALLRTPRLFRDYLATGERFDLPCLVPPLPSIQTVPFRHFVPDSLLQATTDVAPDQWKDYYLTLLQSIPAGITVLLTHPGYDDDELRAITKGSSGWDARWRQRDFDVLRSPEFRSAILKNGVQLISWREIRSALTC